MGIINYDDVIKNNYVIKFLMTNLYSLHDDEYVY